MTCGLLNGTHHFLSWFSGKHDTVCRPQRSFYGMKIGCGENRRMGIPPCFSGKRIEQNPCCSTLFPSLVGDMSNIWRFPGIRVPPVLIHFRLGFSMKSTVQPFGTSWTEDTPYILQVQVPGPGMYEHNPKRVDGKATWRRRLKE